MADPIDEVTYFIRRRRSIKPASMDPNRDVPRDVIALALENATWAPSHGLTEPWRFKVYRAAARERLARRLQSLYRAVTPENEFREEKCAKLGSNPLLANAVIVIWMKRQASRKIAEIEEIEAVACAVQNLHLTLAAAGVGAYWSSPPLLYTSEAREAFGIGTDDRILGLFYIGWPDAATKWPTSQRSPAAELTEWVTS